MSEYFYSPETACFYPAGMKQSYIDSGTWPDDTKEIDESVFLEFIAPPPDGKMRGDINGMPGWVDVPALTQEESVEAADAHKKALIDEANEHMNSKQWPGKAAIGRLKGEELEQYNLWLDYLDSLEAIDTSPAPEVEWPEPPKVT